MQIQWLENYLFGCIFKMFTGWDCPGCGFQRSLLFLINGDIYESVALYPATIPIVLLVIWSIAQMGMTFKSSELITKSLLILSAGTVVISYALKLVLTAH